MIAIKAVLFLSTVSCAFPQVFLSNSTGDSLACPCWPANSATEPADLLLTKIRFELGLTGKKLIRGKKQILPLMNYHFIPATQAYPLRAYGQLMDSSDDNSVTAFYAVPVSLDGKFDGYSFS